MKHFYHPLRWWAYFRQMNDWARMKGDILWNKEIFVSANITNRSVWLLLISSVARERKYDNKERKRKETSISTQPPPMLREIWWSMLIDTLMINYHNSLHWVTGPKSFKNEHVFTHTCSSLCVRVCVNCLFIWMTSIWNNSVQYNSIYLFTTSHL